MSPVQSVTFRYGSSKSCSTFFGAAGHALVLLERFFRRGDGDELDLVELMLPDHAARVAPRGAGLRAEAIGAGGEAQRQLRFVEDRFADEVCQRDFGGGG